MGAEEGGILIEGIKLSCNMCLYQQAQGMLPDFICLAPGKQSIQPCKIKHSPF